MLHSLLARAAWVFGGIAAAAILAFAALVDRAPPSAPVAPVSREAGGEELFAQHCGSCHEAGAMTASLRRETISSLRGQGESSDAEDARIVGYLLGEPASGGGSGAN
ncbi:MAG: c-type cytochrome [Alphaproteobacteria bacterium]